jgi:bacterioferritin
MKNDLLIKGLEVQFGREADALRRYLIEAAALNDPDHETARQLYLREIQEKLERAQYLADQIVLLGGGPTLKPGRRNPAATMRDMLRRDAREEILDEKNYRRLASLAEREHRMDLKQKLEAQAAAEHQCGYEMQCRLW